MKGTFKDRVRELLKESDEDEGVQYRMGDRVVYQQDSYAHEAKIIKISSTREMFLVRWSKDSDEVWVSLDQLKGKI